MLIYKGLLDTDFNFLVTFLTYFIDFWLRGWTTALGIVVAYVQKIKNNNLMNIDKQLHFCISSYGIRIRNTLFVVVIFLPMILLSEIAHTVSLSPYCYALACPILNPLLLLKT